jgi:hypothetical protein
MIFIFFLFEKLQRLTEQPPGAKAQAATSPFSRGRSESAKAVDEADGHALV